MQAWQKKKGLMRAPRFITTLEPLEREGLGNLAATVSEALIARVRSAPKDDLAELTGMPSGHKQAPQDPALARLLPDFQLSGDEEFEGDNAMLRQFNETDICAQKLTNLQIIIEKMGPDGGVHVSLDPAEAAQWVAAINDLRLYVAAAVGLDTTPETRVDARENLAGPDSLSPAELDDLGELFEELEAEMPDDLEEDFDSAPPRLDPRSTVDHTGKIPVEEAEMLVQWLAYNQETLLEAMMDE
ncbi:DUF2017 domain-containing protein [Corynebacterium caspium]|uniref:DUF2017 domain-containing protein n=1 Tax=Corynebacterium caspium TaxID=234828 RepID=UPI0003767569|nr:DUF2017 domain-containing protein [Corynebacterium caspium]WKD58791.1 hypothetical protein CCASP_01875 [Corynebacterium caspium DSM 44850]